jgi:hypothetical protein
MFRNMLMVLMGFFLFVGCSPKVDQKKYENLYRAAKAVEDATEVGVNYQKFGELLQVLSTELSIASDKPKSDTEKKLVLSYLEVLRTYQDSAIVWTQKIEDARHYYVPPGQVYVNGDMVALVSKYSLPTEKHVMPHSRDHFETISGDAILVIWVRATEQLAKANKIYYGK